MKLVCFHGLRIESRFDKNCTGYTLFVNVVFIFLDVPDNSFSYVHYSRIHFFDVNKLICNNRYHLYPLLRFFARKFTWVVKFFFRFINKTDNIFNIFRFLFVILLCLSFSFCLWYLYWYSLLHLYIRYVHFLNVNQ